MKPKHIGQAINRWEFINFHRLGAMPTEVASTPLSLSIPPHASLSLPLAHTHLSLPSLWMKPPCCPHCSFPSTTSSYVAPPPLIIAPKREICYWAISILFWWLDAQHIMLGLTWCWAKVYEANCARKRTWYKSIGIKQKGKLWTFSQLICVLIMFV
jgi:hypothetical protein